jgi:starch-binding outer membrane protein, SusD/RagB family
VQHFKKHKIAHLKISSMKKYILLLIVFVTTLAGCTKKFLDEVATNQVAADGYFNNYEQANTVLTGVYQQLASVFEFSSFIAPWGMNGTDEVSVPNYSGSRDVHVYNIQFKNTDISNMWKKLYNGIYRANLFIARAGAMAPAQIKTDDQNRLIGEAKFLRALFYFNLTKIWGDVPLTITEIKGEADIPNTRAKVADVYKQIIEDLQFAKANCRTSLLSGAATKGAATALLGRVYLQMTGWPLNDASKAQLAANELKEVIDNPAYGLALLYADVFSEFKETTIESMKENIFVVKFDGPGKGLGGQMGTFMGPSGNVADGGAFRTTHISVNSCNLYYDSSRDTRFFQNIAFRNATTGAASTYKGDWAPMKWVKPQKWLNGTVPNYGYDSPIDFALIRFSDVLLMYAEALNGVNNGPTQAALDAVNRVRQRAKKPGSAGLYQYTLAMGMTKENFIDTLLKNRYQELCFEGLRKDDLIRTNRIFTYLRNLPNERWDTPAMGRPNDIKDHHRLFPIPDDERLVSKLPQNDGY